MFRVAVAGDDPPIRVTAAAAELGIELAPHRTLQSMQGVAGYLMNSFGQVPPTPVDADLLGAMSELSVVIYLGQSRDPMDYAGLVDLAELRARRIALLTTPAGNAVAEAAIGMMIAADLNLAAAAADPPARIVRQGLAGATLGIVGLGQIGLRVAELAATLEMQIRYFSRHDHPSVEQRLGAQYRSLERLCAESDFISVHTSNSAPVGLIGATLECANGAMLINTTSAPRLVDPEALLNALHNGWVRRAVVEGPYPEPWQSQLASCGVDRFVSLPVYCSWDTPSARAAGWDQAIAGFSAAADKKPLPNRLV